LDIFDSEVLDCAYGHYPWDDWERDALAAGVPKDLVGLGRLTVLIRNCFLRAACTERCAGEGTSVLKGVRSFNSS
jgi:hypothetical protein